MYTRKPGSDDFHSFSFKQHLLFYIRKLNLKLNKHSAAGRLMVDYTPSVRTHYQ